MFDHTSFEVSGSAHAATTWIAIAPATSAGHGPGVRGARRYARAANAAHAPTTANGHSCHGAPVAARLPIARQRTHVTAAAAAMHHAIGFIAPNIARSWRAR